jgi:hypothetical protein
MPQHQPLVSRQFCALRSLRRVTRWTIAQPRMPSFLLPTLPMLPLLR